MFRLFFKLIELYLLLNLVLVEVKFILTFLRNN